MAKFFNPKYKAKPTVCHQNHKHHSKFEASYCDTLALLLKNKQIKSYETQVKYTFVVNDVKICNHFVDFVVTNLDGSIEVHEPKGFSLGVWQIKYRLFQALYPEIPYHVIRYRGGRAWKQK